jgi:hydrogenase maturation protease
MDRQVLVLGIGNVLNTDEGVGVHAVRKLRQEFAELEAAVAGVELQDGGTLGLSLLPLVEEATHLLLLDAVDVGEPPGTLVELEKEQIPYQGSMKLSQHQVTFQEVLGLALIRQKLPEHLHLIGIQPASLAIGVDLSPEVQAVLPQMLKRATRVLSAWGVKLPAAGDL